MDATDDPGPSTAASTPAPAAHRAPQTNHTTPTNTATPTNTTANTTNAPQAHVGTNPEPTTQPDPPQQFNVPDIDLARTASASVYRDHVRALHKAMSGGDAADYHESKIPLPRSLQGIKTSQVITKLLVLNPALDSPAWACVTAEVIGNNLVVGTVTESGRKMIDTLKEMKVEPGRVAKVPTATKPNNCYYVELLLPVERELHVELLEAFLLKFPSAKSISMPGKKPWGTMRRLRLFFNHTTAPREVFTTEDANTPIREITLPCGTAAQVIHKWQRLNQYRPPHLSHRWNPTTTTRSYAAAAATPTTPAPSQRTAQTNPFTAPLPTPPHIGAQATTLPDKTPPGSSNGYQGSPAQEHERPTPPGEMDWAANEPLAIEGNHQPQRGQTDPRLSSTPTAPTTNLNPSDPTPTRPRTTNGSDPRATTTTASQPPPRTESLDNTPAPYDPPRRRQSTNHQTPMQPAITPATDRPQGTPTSTTGRSDPTAWHQIMRTRSRKVVNVNQPAAARATLQRSGSRNRKNKAATNQFAPLDFQVLPAFEDSDEQPIEVILPVKPSKPPRRKYKTSRKSMSAQAHEALTHKQHIRHPAQTLQHLSPNQTQVMIRSSSPDVAPAREKLIHQIALLRAARTNITPHHITLEKIADEAFMEHVKTRLSYCQDPPKCTIATETDIPLRAILERDEMRVRASICFAWVDLATRAILPHLYDVWPDQPVWQGKPLTWLPADDEDVPCLQDEALATLAACPTLHRVWQHISSTTPTLNSALSTAATQMHLHVATMHDNHAAEIMQQSQRE